VPTAYGEPSAAPAAPGADQQPADAGGASGSDAADEQPRDDQEANNEIDLSLQHTTDAATSEPSAVTAFRDEKPPSAAAALFGAGEPTAAHSSSPLLTNRIRSTKVLEESNSGRNMPDTAGAAAAAAAPGDSFPWTWAKSILLEKPVQKKTAQN